MSFTYRPSRRRNGVLRRSRFYSAKIRMEWETGLHHVVPLKVKDKRVADQLLAEEEKRRRMENSGQIPPQERQKAAERPLNELLDDFLAEMLVTRHATRTVKKYKELHLLLKACRWQRIRDVAQSGFEAWRAQANLAPKTLNDRQKNFGVFWSWLKRKRMAGDNPIADVELVDSRRNEKYRRALTHEEVFRLLAAASPGRAVVYLLAVKTGLRRNEILQLTVGDLELDGPAPFVRVRASISKSPKEARLRLMPDVVAAVRTILPDHALGAERPFIALVPRVRQMRKDLAKAGIPFLDSTGRRADFHALRDTFGTHLVLAGAPPFLVKELMRLSTVQQAEKYYIDATHMPMSATLEKLPMYELQKDTQKDTQTLVAAGL